MRSSSPPITLPSVTARRRLPGPRHPGHVLVRWLALAPPQPSIATEEATEPPGAIIPELSGPDPGARDFLTEAMAGRAPDAVLTVRRWSRVATAQRSQAWTANAAAG